MTHYLLRLDDLCPTMKRQFFDKLMVACRACGVTGILGVVPDNQDASLKIEEADKDFWHIVRSLADEGWIIAQHGYRHVYETKQSGLLHLRNRSEFAGLSYQQQYQKIANGKKILCAKLERDVTWWMAPAHSFDEITCKALCDLGFTHVTDGIALYPFQQYGLTWIPHQLWRPRVQLLGVWTIGLHLNTISEQRLAGILAFITAHALNMRRLDLAPREHALNPLFRTYWYAKFAVLKQFA